ncbi:hypothetical protein GEMRC1_000841 [Eukaryota sp. GEM-RC1]
MTKYPKKAAVQLRPAIKNRSQPAETSVVNSSNQAVMTELNSIKKSILLLNDQLKVILHKQETAEDKIDTLFDYMLAAGMVINTHCDDVTE